MTSTSTSRSALQWRFDFDPCNRRSCIQTLERAHLLPQASGTFGAYRRRDVAVLRIPGSRRCSKSSHSQTPALSTRFPQRTWRRPLSLRVILVAFLSFLRQSIFIMSCYPEVCLYFLPCISVCSFPVSSQTRASTGPTTTDTRPI